MAALLGFLAASFLVINLGNLVTDTDAGSWYAQLNSPAWSPPGWAFGPAWTINCLLMGIAAWIVWRRDGFRDAPIALPLWGLQLLFTGAWTFLFFGGHWLTLSAIEIVLATGLVGATVVAFAFHHGGAAALLLPYLLWMIYASTLSIGYAVLNR